MEIIRPVFQLLEDFRFEYEYEIKCV